MSNDYITSKISVNCVVEYRKKILLVQQARPERVRGRWSVPGGKIASGEGFEDAVCREVFEETGLQNLRIAHRGIIHEAPGKTVKHIFRVRSSHYKIKFPADEIMATCWFSVREISRLNRDDKLRGPWVYQAVKMAVGKRNSRRSDH